MIGAITATRLNVRSHPDVHGRRLGTLKEGVVIEILGSHSGWFEFHFQGIPAFVAGQYVELIEETVHQQQGVVSANLLNVRDRPAAHGSVIGRLAVGATVAISNHFGDWLEIEFNGQAAYVHGDHVQRWNNDDVTYGSVDASKLNVRSAPDRHAAILGQLVRGTRLIIESVFPGWYQIRFNGTKGFVVADYVRDEEEPLPQTRAANQDDGSVDEPVLPPRPVVLDETPDSLIPLRLLRVDGDATERRVAGTWNRFGGMLSPLAERKGIDVGCAVAVMCVESNGQGFSGENDNRMIIRFENHKMWSFWGKSDPQRFNKYFRYRKGQAWKDHQWRNDGRRRWQSFHGSQSKEWQVLDFARSLSDEAALLSISMGAPQIMGFHYKRLGYDSVAQMFEAFCAGMTPQIEGFFDFFSAAMVQRLQQLDFVGFAGMYNGSGQKQEYGRRIKAHYDAYRRLTMNH